MLSLIQIIPIKFRDKYRSNWHEFKRELRIKLGQLKRQFIRPPFPKLKNGKVYLHLGCGSISNLYFINIDGLPAPHIHYVRAIDNLTNFQSNSADLIYACHCLEHFPYAKVPKVLAEWFRVLKKGGILRLSVPDFDQLVNVYKESDNNMNKILPFLMGGQDYRFNFHLAVFNRYSLEKMLIETGFKQVQEWQPGSEPLTTFNDCSKLSTIVKEKKYNLSLNLEAFK
ncbi:MAG: methyltransferase domain-containing protein [Coleofasciculus chthonoplastes F3-SA18-01]|uniref:class I SAM-dependent methyltransferase n=1 Tax=Coleofasciculus chthonoplastes TaxID=64178 RepID=UPI0032F2E37C